MAVAIPVIAAFASAGTAVAAAGGIAAAMGTVSGFLSIAGAALTTVGAITGKKDLLKIGGFMSLGGGIGTAYNAYTAGAGASSAGGAAAEQLTREGFRASELAGTAATNAAMEGGASLGGSLMDSARAVTSAAPDMGSQMVGDFGSNFSGGAQATGGASSGATPMFEPSIYGSQPLPLQDIGQGMQSGMTQGVPSATGMTSHTSELAKGASTMNQSELIGLLKDAAGKTGNSLSGVADFLTKNKELVKIGGDALGGMYGPQAEQMDFQKSIYNRRMANMNKPVKLYYGGQ